MAPVVVQRGQDHDTDGNSTVTATFGTDPTPGNMLIAVYKDNSSTATLTLPTGWAWATSFPYTSGTSRQNGVAYKVAESADTTSVTMTSTSAATKILAIVEVSGVRAPSSTALTSSAGGSVTTKAFATTGALPVADCYVIAYCDTGTANGGQVSVSDGFIFRHNVNDAPFSTLLMVADKITTATTALTPTFTWVSANIAFGAQVVFPLKDDAPADGPDVYVRNSSGTWVPHKLTVEP